MSEVNIDADLVRTAVNSADRGDPGRNDQWLHLLHLAR